MKLSLDKKAAVVADWARKNAGALLALAKYVEQKNFFRSFGPWRPEEFRLNRLPGSAPRGPNFKQSPLPPAAGFSFPFRAYAGR